jgi:phosphoglucosamine mutase
LRKYFGTDGIRGIASKDLSAALAFSVGKAAAIALAKTTEWRPRIVIGTDTRISCAMLECALIAGLCSSGADVMRLDVISTPAVAFITRDSGADAGIVISASHNSYEHNGIKIFNSEGFKLSDELEEKIEYLSDNPEQLELKSHSAIGRIVDDGLEYKKLYCEHVTNTAFGEIARLRVAIDSSNGAAVSTVRDIFSSFPIDVTYISDKPNGVNINDKCGSTYTPSLAKAVVDGGCDLGIAFDGDADRCIIIDEKGGEVNGDKLMAICGAFMKDAGLLKNNTIVATVMSNLGFHEYVKTHDMSAEVASVGDRNVLELMRKGGFNLGGEQSGHIIFLDDSTTGDGQLAAVKFLSVVCASGKKVSELVGEIPTYPQILKNQPIRGGEKVRNAIMDSGELSAAIAAEERCLDGHGRVLVRPSGTEALIRVMIEAKTNDEAKASANRIALVIESIEKSM